MIVEMLTVCPNCHRALHHSSKRGELQQSLYSRIASLEKYEGV